MQRTVAWIVIACVGMPVSTFAQFTVRETDRPSLSETRATRPILARSHYGERQGADVSEQPSPHQRIVPSGRVLEAMARAVTGEWTRWDGVPPPQKSALLSLPWTGGWEIVPGLPEGTRLRLASTTGEVTGTVVEASSESVTLRDYVAGRGGFTLSGVSSGDNLTIRRETVQAASVLDMPRRYVLSGEPDPVAVRHVLTRIGTGKGVTVTTDTKTVQGTIQSIGDHEFSLTLKGRDVLRVPYQGISEVKGKSMNRAAKVAMIIGIVGGGLALLMYHSCVSDPDGICG